MTPARMEETPLANYVPGELGALVVRFTRKAGGLITPHPSAGSASKPIMPFQSAFLSASYSTMAAVSQEPAHPRPASNCAPLESSCKPPWLPAVACRLMSLAKVLPCWNASCLRRSPWRHAVGWKPRASTLIRDKHRGLASKTRQWVSPCLPEGPGGDQGSHSVAQIELTLQRINKICSAASHERSLAPSIRRSRNSQRTESLAGPPAPPKD
ncbi:hypothetical protein B0T14DRAFT_76782 [Immersiella caudata]|uniref:Uncharacterized protein n=1 Tax=Immersiella caudata TaxID=314043 RepID=A0AA39XGT2_9PEZI|nr:hypothetical protein B0T14DRAFT_76782 [Immersiella caudata]